MRFTHTREDPTMMFFLFSMPAGGSDQPQWTACWHPCNGASANDVQTATAAVRHACKSHGREALACWGFQLTGPLTTVCTTLHERFGPKLHKLMLTRFMIGYNKGFRRIQPLRSDPTAEERELMAVDTMAEKLLKTATAFGESCGMQDVDD